jgi:hypothetical protein
MDKIKSVLNTMALVAIMSGLGYWMMTELAR